MRDLSGPERPATVGAVVEHRLVCPHCWQSITILLDLSVPDQQYVEDCEVCCNPIDVHVRAEDGEIVDFVARRG